MSKQLVSWTCRQTRTALPGPIGIANQGEGAGHVSLVNYADAMITYDFNADEECSAMS